MLNGSPGGALGCFHVGALVSAVAITRACRFWWDLGYRFTLVGKWGGVAESHVFNFIRNFQTRFCRGVTSAFPRSV